MTRDAALGREHADELDSKVGQRLDHNLGNGTVGQRMVDSATAIPHKADATFNNRNML